MERSVPERISAETVRRRRDELACVGRSAMSYVRSVGMTLTSNVRLIRRQHQGQVLLALLTITVFDVLISSALTWYSLIPGIEQEDDGLVVNIATLFWPVVIVSIWLFGKPRAQRLAGFVYVGMVTLDLLVSVGGLVFTIGSRTGGTGGFQLLQDAVVVWLTAIFVFAIWYWLLDSGGPVQRAAGGPGTPRPDFVFPQQAHSISGWSEWQPQFVDYLFLAFNTGTAFGPSDTQVLSVRAKLLVMSQALLSLIVLAVLAARAISILR